MNPELQAAIYNIGKDVAGLTGGFWFIQAPQKNVYPYSVTSRVDGIPDRDSVNTFDDEYLQMNIYHTDHAALITISELFKTAFDNKQSNIIMASYWCIDITLQFNRGPKKLDDVFQLTQQYKIHIQKK